MKKYIIWAMMGILCEGISYAQQAPQFTQYLYNPVSINPAFAGSTERFSAILMHRSQWSGFDGAPSTQIFSAHSPLPNDKVGLGLSLVSDGLGEERFHYLYGDFSYTLRVSRTVRLALGIKAGFTHYSLSPGLLGSPGIQSDPYFSSYTDSWSPNMGVGGLLHGEGWHLAISAPQLFQVDFIENPGNDTAYRVMERPNLYITGGYGIDLTRFVELKPTTMLIISKGSPISIDVGTNVTFYDRLMLGINYRINSYDAIGGLGSFRLGKRMTMGYAYEIPISGIRPYTGGTHEFFLRYDLILDIN